MPPRRGAAIACALLAGLAAAGAPSRGHADLGGAVAVGGGVHDGDAISAIDARADWASGGDGDRGGDGGGVALGLGVRVRAGATGLVRSDWDSVGDWIAILRYLELRGDRAVVVAGAQPTVTLGDGALIAGVVPAALVDRRATGAHARVTTERARFEAVIDDVARPMVVGARGAYVPDDDHELAIELAADPLAPSAPFAVVALAGALGVRERNVTSRVDAGVSVQATRDAPGLGVWIGAATGAELGAVRFALRGEVTAGSAHDVAAPFGPLYAIDRDTLGDRARAGGLTGVGGAVRLDLDALGVRASAAMRARPGLGGEFDARLAAPAFRDVQLAALVAARPSQRLVVAGGELRVRAGRRAFVAVEAARQIDPAMATAAWQATAWLGIATAP